MRQLKILLLTNCDSDNLGDQVIKASDIGLLHVVMRNLGWDQNEHRVISKPAAIVSKKYIETKDVSLLTTVNKTIASCDMILFGGAPMFNYRYQIFYERTATILDLAEKYHKPVVFSAIGIESYDEQDERCQRLKSALHQRCVKQITTRDGLEELKQYSANQTIPLGKVADPAVFSSSVFRKWRTKKEAQEQHRTERKIGLFVLRGGGFKDNGYDLSREDAKKLWVSLVQELKERGLRYELLTSGHFGDEAFLDALIRDCNIPASHCVFNMNTPEQLIEKIASYDAILSTRLHPSIISYSLGVPALSLIWNNKVERFYENIGYPDRAIPVTQFNPGEVADRLQEIIQLGVKRDPEYMISVYESLFEGVRQCLSDLTSQETCQQHDADALPYDYETVCRLCPDYPGTSDDMLNQKLVRKFRRTYSKYNALHHSLDRSGEQKKEF